MTSEAVRKRAKRGTLPSETGPDGRLYVWVDDETDGGSPTGWTMGRRDALVERLEDEVEYLRQQLAQTRAELTRRAEEHAEEMRRRDHLLAAATERISAIEAPPDTPSEARESPATASEESGKGGSSPPSEPTEAESRPWWRRFFGFD